MREDTTETEQATGADAKHCGAILNITVAAQRYLISNDPFSSSAKDRRLKTQDVECRHARDIKTPKHLL